MDNESKADKLSYKIALALEKPIRDKDGKSWGDKRDEIILKYFGYDSENKGIMNAV